MGFRKFKSVAVFTAVMAIAIASRAHAEAVAYTFGGYAGAFGDANLDGKVDITDFNIFTPNFSQSTTLGWEAGDFNYSGSVNIGDFNLFAGNFGQPDSGTTLGLPAAEYAALDAFAAANGLTLTSVPEPTTIGLLVLGTAALSSRRRRRQCDSCTQ